MYCTNANELVIYMINEEKEKFGDNNNLFSGQIDLDKCDDYK